MAQLVGKTCVICGQKIASTLTAAVCRLCQNPVHSDCQRGFKATGTGCKECGSTQAAPLTESASRPFDPLPVLVVVGALLVAGFLWLFVAQPWLPAPTVIVPLAVAKEDAKTPSESKPGERPTIVIETSKGTIKAQLFTDLVPETANNFKDLVEQHYYDGIIFHRVIKGFMLQGGDPTGTGTGGRTAKGLPPKRLRDEFHNALQHDRAGLLSMANSGPNTGDTQFFITTEPAPHLNRKHAIFGEVVDGMDVVRAIENTPTNQQDRPLETVTIIKATVEKK